ncbi:hypothetical protein TNIN_256831, partial [Trichonephila inaurata madagascariensis]
CDSAEWPVNSKKTAFEIYTKLICKLFSP